MLDWNYIVGYVLASLALALLGYLTPKIISLFKAGIAWLKTKTNNEKVKTLLDMAGKVVEDAVIVANQTIVETLKKNGKFDADTAVEIKDQVVENVKNTLTQDEKDAIAQTSSLVLEDWIKQQIEVFVNKNK